MPLTQGVTLGPYEIHSLLGAGGMGEVYLARDARLQRTVAIKILPAHLQDCDRGVPLDESPVARATCPRTTSAANWVREWAAAVLQSDENDQALGGQNVLLTLQTFGTNVHGHMHARPASV